MRLGGLYPEGRFVVLQPSLMKAQMARRIRGIR